MKEIKQETNRPKGNLPYQDVNRPFRMQFVVPGPGITIEQDKNGVLYISAQGGSSVSDIIAGDNIEIERREDGRVVISAVNSVANISAGENVTITVDPVTGASVINSIIGGETNEHYKGVFDTTEDLIAADPDPEIGDYGLIKSITITNGETSWSGQYKYCFFINGAWTVVDQMLTFTKNLDLLQQYYSVGGSSPVIYLHEIARSGNFWDLNNIPIVATPEVTVEGTTVTVICATEGAEIWYTTDGSMPHVNGTKYTGPITASGATTFRFVGIKNGMINSLEAVASADYELQAPVIELDWHTGEISMTNPNQDGNGDPVGAIYFKGTGYGNWTLYNGPINKRGERNVDWIAKVVSDNKESAETSCHFVTVPQVRVRPSENYALGTKSFSAYFDNNGNDFNGEIRYTTNGIKPEYGDTPYVSPVYFPLYGEPFDVWCTGFAEGYLPDNGNHVIRFGYEKPSAPGISYDPQSSIVTLFRTSETQGIQLRLYADPEDNTGCRIYYTLDGSTPTDQSTLYTGPFPVSESVTVKAVLIAYGQYSSDVSELEIQVMAQPQFSLDWHTGNVSMTNPNGEGSIYYTLDGSEPTSESNVYYAPVTLTNNTTVKAKVIAETGSSATATQTFTRAQAPKINDGNVSLTYNLNILTGIYDVKMNTSQQGGVIRYTSRPGDFPADPTWSDNQFVDELSAPFFEEWTFEARTFAEGFIPSAVVTQTFGLDFVHPVVINYDEDSATVSFQRQWFTAQIPLQTNNNTPELGCRVFYTLDGSTPDDTSALWDGNPVSVAPGTTVKALLVCYGQYESEVATYNVPGGLSPMFIQADRNGYVSFNNYNYLSSGSINLEYSFDKINWVQWPYTVVSDYQIFDNITLNSGERIYIRGDNKTGLGSSQTKVSRFNLDPQGKFFSGGNILSLLDKEEKLTEVPPYGLYALFNSQSSLFSTPDMNKITLIGECGCMLMFSYCPSIESASDMNDLEHVRASGCEDMYSYCEKLAHAANIPSLVHVGANAFSYTYADCESLSLLENNKLTFDFIALPFTDESGKTYSTPQDVANWMTTGN